MFRLIILIAIVLVVLIFIAKPIYEYFIGMRQPVAKLGHYKFSGAYITWEEKRIYHIDEEDDTIRRCKGPGGGMKGRCDSLTVHHLNQKQLNKLIEEEAIKKENLDTLEVGHYMPVFNHRWNGKKSIFWETVHYD